MDSTWKKRKQKGKLKTTIMNRCLIIIISVFINQMLFSQEKLQSINFEKEKPEIIKFLKEFGTTKDAIKIQKYIAFPYFIGRHLCNPMVGEGGASIREMTK